MIRYQISRELFIEKLAAIVDSSNRMVLVVTCDGSVEVMSTFFNYEDVQKLAYLLQRTSCEWWFKPIDDKMVKLRIRLFV